jgi:alanine racemase
MKTHIEINSENILHNYDQFKNRIGDNVKLMPILKSNAYGHGLIEVGKILNGKADWFGVDSIDEAVSLKKEGINKPILILGYTLIDRLKEVVDNGFHQVVANVETLENLDYISKAENKQSFIHLKIETGTSRQGIMPNDIDKYLNIILANEKLKLAGVSTHYANIEDTTDHSYAEMQLEKYVETVRYIENKGFSDFIRHTACSAAAIIFPETHFDLVRVGISMYGLWSSDATKVSAKQKDVTIDLKPALTWKTKVAHIKKLPAGTCVSYGCTEKLPTDSKIAVLPIGYWDGFDRGLSSVGNVLINGYRCKVIGRVCMNMTVVDVTHVEDIKLEDEVILIGSQYDETITADDLASKLNTINYEVVTRINPLIKRIII